MATATLSLVPARQLTARTSAPTRISPLSLRSSTVTRLLGTVVATIVAAGCATGVIAIISGHDHLFGLTRLLDLNGEHNIPSWYSSAALLTAAALLYAIAAATGEAQTRRGWRALSLLFVALSLDEAAGVHELTNRPLRAMLDVGPVLYFPWILAGGCTAIIMGIWFMPWLRTLPADTRALLVLAGGMFVGGALGVEAITAPIYAISGKGTVLHAVLVTIEESLEMIAIVLLIVAALRYAARSGLTATLVCEDRDAPVGRRRGFLHLGPRFSCRVLLCVVAGLAAASLLAQAAVQIGGYRDVYGIARLLNVAREGNVPTWYQASALLGCAGLLGIIAGVRRREANPFAARWVLLSLVFVYLSLDEASAIHELSVRPLRVALGASGLLYYPWILVGAGAVILLGIAYVRFLWALPAPTRKLFIASAAIFLLGALGIEALGGMHAEQFGRDNFQYAVLTTVEEGFEMLGIAVFTIALLEYIRDYVGRVVLTPATQPAARRRSAVAPHEMAQPSCAV
jgi:hypothetical protein